MVERRDDRYYFLGRRSGVINVGGLKVYPEEVEAAINRHPAVRMSMVRSQRSPITGSLVAADVVLEGGARGDGDGGARRLQARDPPGLSRHAWPPHKIPATIRFVPALEIGRRRQAGPSSRKVIVTGGSRGLGLGIVRRLVCDGLRRRSPSRGR